jgi:hypothetical protein
MSDLTEDGCSDVVALLDRILAGKPKNVDEPLLEATECVVRLRDGYIAALRGGNADARIAHCLERTNAVLSQMVGSHYTLVGLRWKRIEHARDALKALLDA